MVPFALVVGESHRNGELLADVARAEGWDARAVPDGGEALAEARLRKVDLVLADHALPDGPIEDFLRALRAIPTTAGATLLVTTPQTCRDTKISLLSAGADDFLEKPVSVATVRHRLRRRLAHPEAPTSLAALAMQRDRALATLAERNAELEALTMALVSSLERATALSDYDTGRHLRRVGLFSEVLARRAGCAPGFVEQVRRYARLHDVGKVGVPDAILKKPGKLDPDEYTAMKRHAEVGSDLLLAAGLPPVASHIARHHHERWDGRGYPDGLAGAAIPLEARIVGVVDVFDAVVSPRCYKPGQSWESSRRLLAENAGIHFDPDLVGHFLAAQEELQDLHQRDEAAA